MSGSVQVDTGGNLLVTADSFTAAGVNMQGGTVHAESVVLDLEEMGNISGHGHLFGNVNLGPLGTVAGSGSGLLLHGDVSGSGSISNATIDGNIDVGNSIGHLTLTDVVLGSDDTMVTVEIGGADPSLYDTITLAGDTTLAGYLDVEFINEFVPETGDVFDILDFEPANLSGLFNSVNLPALASGLAWDDTNLYTTGELLVSLSTSQASGDFDGDFESDVDGDGSVGGDDDFLIWQNNFPYPTAISSVPEPNSLVLLALGGLVALRRRRT